MVPFVIDNGSYEIKFGHANLVTPFRANNGIAKDKYGASYLSNHMKTIRDISSATIRRPHELGQLVSWELEGCIWDYCLYNPDEFDGFHLGDNTREQDLILTETCFTLPELSKNSDQVVFEEYEFATMFKSPASGFMPFANLIGNKNMEHLCGKDTAVNTDYTTATTKEYRDFQLVIDSGFNCTWVVPIIKGVPFYKAIKKMDIGGRFLNGLLKETLSFRHYNMMDETILLNNIKEKCLFVSPVSYFDSFKTKQQQAVEYVLPDFQTSFLGYLVDESNRKGIDRGSVQTITLTDERFAVPETFFHPEMANILKPGLVETILEAISMVPEPLRPILVSNIVCVGGNFKLPHMSSRLTSELQRQLPTDWTCRVTVPSSSDCELAAWNAMAQFSSTDVYKTTRVTREEYLEHGTDWCSKHRFTYQNWI
ncbi:Arp6p KNAG_0G02010 [Huiozyma naganishii CBS 8797]|uniref:Actin-like protein ARP6 n=1 Tax=Huiozyma naganishii (strain ATCC MYA-139 / BCRC 22969 / CBS 8797 / KCTC 17520 / NBRC 10181 / NCYC 3082 / Yp74L-3) TaxID=1071383 RepID=J7RNT2_HUIN7|nr:hypothetical protein KNAG_0G02010 [Kazachstania naganishii CBS 8797]CCK71258.1 hypothetical protein KNAG_0G02010 [Kazachstania naganishii CBS 8797]